MLKETGYICVGKDRNTITYRNEDEDCELDFWIDETISKEHRGELAYITMQELKAINKKCEELGWI